MILQGFAGERDGILQFCDSGVCFLLNVNVPSFVSIHESLTLQQVGQTVRCLFVIPLASAEPESSSRNDRNVK